MIGELHAATCLVCGFTSSWIQYECDNCGKISPLDDGGGFACPHCGRIETDSQVYSRLDQSDYDPKEYVDADVPGNCSYCDGYHTVCRYEERYLCTSCFELTDHMARCGWCNEPNNGDMEDSYWKGCSACDGKAGWDKDD